MTWKQQVERVDVHAMQREKERERRRLRDRQRRQNMSQEQRDRHLARRRRNYQLRRLRAQNAKLLDTQQTKSNAADRINNNHHHYHSTSSPNLNDLLPTSPVTQGEAQKLQKTSRRLRVTDIKQLARRLHCDAQQQNKGALTNYASSKRLRLTHVKRLARAIKVAVN